jgi:hypothetical protein
MDTSPVGQPSIPPPPPPRSGCFGKGCIALLIAAFLLFILVIGGAWFACNYIIRTFTETNARSVQIEQASPQEMQLAEAKMDTLRSAIRNRQETTVAFTAADLNTLIAKDPGFSGARGRAHFAIGNSTVSLDLSAPLDSMSLKLLKSHWFNGRVQFGVSYVDDEFTFDIKSAEANGHRVPRALFSPEFSRSFSRSFNESFHRESHRRSDDLWRHLKMISVQDDKLVVTTRGM